jgi:hypothetical protein
MTDLEDRVSTLDVDDTLDAGNTVLRTGYDACQQDGNKKA